MTKTEHFNPATFLVIDRVTGQEVPMQLFIENVSNDYWEKAFAKTIGEYIGVTGTNQNKVLAYLVRAKTPENIVNNTQQEIADELKVNKSTVSKVMKLLQDKKLIKLVRNGCYMISPKMIRHGGKIRGAIMMRVWGEL